MHTKLTWERVRVKDNKLVLIACKRSTEEFAANLCHCSAMPQVVWEIEDPSEFRPDFKLGKEKGEFRVFDNVRSLDLRPAFPSLVVRDEKLAKEYICYGREGG